MWVLLPMHAVPFSISAIFVISFAACMHHSKVNSDIAVCMQVTMKWLQWTGQWHGYRQFTLLKSSVRGPHKPFDC